MAEIWAYQKAATAGLVSTLSSSHANLCTKRQCETNTLVSVILFALTINIKP